MHREWVKYREVFSSSGTYPWSFVTQIVHNGQPSHGGDLKVVWAGICHDVHIQLKIVQGTLNAVKYRYDLLGLIVLPFLEQHLHMKYISDDTIFIAKAN
jgi:hypothetical protein